MTWTLHHGDCLDPVTGLASLADRSVDHVISDPPYDEHTHGAARQNATGYKEACSSSRAAISRNMDLGFDPLTDDQMRQLAVEFERVCRRWVAVFCTVEMISSWRASIEAAGLEYVRCCVWDRIGGAPQFTGDRPGMAVEAIVVAHRKGRKRWNAGGKRGIYRHPIVLNRGGNSERLHTTQKPLDLMRELVEDFTDPGDTILDPFAGSGTTGVACNQLGRNFIGWERDAKYHEIATRRLRGDEAKPNPAQPSLLDLIGGAA
ncbi:MAG: site-specific DNA-methyltransferase [Burkholderiaceae bacterium]|nr:site-specific DNA-methyltransferase [Burkholderiaceae bacterium]